MKNKNVKRIVLSLILCLGLASVACSPKGVPDGFVESEVIAQAKEVITLMSNEDFEAVAETFSPEMKTALDAKALEAAVGQTIRDLGAFVEYKSEATTSGKNAQIGDFAVAVIGCAYENGNATYTISIDANDQVTGLYLK